jgi:hypothetical protein
MARRNVTKLKFAPTNVYVEAKVVPLPATVIDTMLQGWWSSDALLPRFDPTPIDRHWRWKDERIERKGIELDAEMIGVVTGDGLIQGAMQLSKQPYPSGIVSGAGSLLVELLFTAPWNRPQLRRDGLEYYKGVGLVLLAWAAITSRERGYGGRLRLDGSPDFLEWYERRGFLKLDEESVVWQDIIYTPMELPPGAARRLLNPPQT